ncbi:MAG: hypothetical protein C0402_02500 [Thermodesulfovibrio sp.]|nr:hypothetical protein [Thermodesulfovibrio sp.]
MMELPLNGNIRTTSLVRILVYLNRQRKTGTLSLATAAWTKKLFVHTGDVVFASSTYEDDRLGEMLLKAGKISVEQYDRSVEILKTSSKRQGAILVELGYLTPKDLFWGVKYQVREIIQSLFLAEEAAYAFIEGDIPDQEVITLKMSMGNLIYESVKHIDNWTRIRNEMPETSSVLRLSSDPLSLFQDIELSVQDKKILSLIDGTRTINEVIEASWLASFEALKILYVLWSLGIVAAAEQSMTSGAADAASPQETGISMSLNDILQPHPEEDEALLQKINTMYAKIDTLSPAELLETDAGSSGDTIKKNYYRLAKEFHPDRYFAIRDNSVKSKLTNIFDAITKAYNLLKDDASRASYFNPAAATEKKTGQEEPPRAEDQFKRGIEEFKKGNYWGAADHFRWVTKLSPENGAYWNYLSLALSKIPGRLKDAEEALLTAAKLEPLNADLQANLGLLYLKAGMKKRAAGFFEKALRIDASNDKALKGLQQAEL